MIRNKKEVERQRGVKGKDSLIDVTGRLFDICWSLFPFCC
jgi:hypothetical protein